MSRAAAPAATPKSARRRDDILRQAADLFDRQGYSNTSLDDIARAVGIRREGIYYYFRNRAEILLHIIEPQIEALLSGLRDILQDPTLDHVARLRGAVRNHLERFDRHCLEMTVSMREGSPEAASAAGDGLEGVHATMDQVWRDYEQMWTELVAAGQAAGAFRPAGEAGDPKMLAFAILGMCNWLARWYDPAGGVPIDDLIDSYAGLAGRGLLAEQPSKRLPD